MPFDYEPWHGYYLQAWQTLRYDRNYGAFGGETPILYTAISAYAKDHGIAGEHFLVFKTLLNEVDSEYLKIVAERAKAKEAEGTRDG